MSMDAGANDLLNGKKTKTVRNNNKDKRENSKTLKVLGTGNKRGKKVDFKSARAHNSNKSQKSVNVKSSDDKSRTSDNSLSVGKSDEKFSTPLRSNTKSVGEIDYELDRWPFCLVWTPLPFVTWFIPVIGHTGIATSQGVIYDFSDDFVVSVDNFSFGRPTKYYQFDPKNIGKDKWDKAIISTADHYSKTRHSLCFNNCHQHIAGALNIMSYQDKIEWNQLDIWYLITFKSSYVSWASMVKQWWPFFMNLLILIVLISLVFR